MLNSFEDMALQALQQIGSMASSDSPQAFRRHSSFAGRRFSPFVFFLSAAEDQIGASLVWAQKTENDREENLRGLQNYWTSP